MHRLSPGRAIAAAALALTLVSCTSAPAAQEFTSAVAPSHTADPTSLQAEATTDSDSATPQLIGLTQDEAVAKLNELHLRHTVEWKETGGTVGTVIEQTPAAGEPRPQSLTITVVGTPPTVPNVVGRSETDARRALEELGFKVDVQFVPDANTPERQVTGQSPAAGTPNQSTVTLSVVVRPTSVALAKLTETGNNDEDTMQSADAQSNGKSFSDALVSDEYGTDFGTGFDLSRNVEHIRGVIGIRDDAKTSCKATVTFTDEQNKKLGDSPYQIAFGKLIEVDLDVSGKLRLTIDGTSTDDSCAVVLGDFVAETLDPLPTDGSESEVGEDSSEPAEDGASPSE